MRTLCFLAFLALVAGCGPSSDWERFGPVNVLLEGTSSVICRGDGGADEVADVWVGDFTCTTSADESCSGTIRVDGEVSSEATVGCGDLLDELTLTSTSGATADEFFSGDFEGQGSSSSLGETLVTLEFCFASARTQDECE